MERIKRGCRCITELCHWINLYYDVSIWCVIYVVYGLQEERRKDTVGWWMAREALLHSGHMRSKAACWMSCITNCLICSCFKPLLLKRHTSPVTRLVFHKIPYQTQCRSFSSLLNGVKTTDVLFLEWQTEHGWFISARELALGTCILDLFNFFIRLLSVSCGTRSANLPWYLTEDVQL